MAERVEAALGLNVKEFNDGLERAAGGLKKFTKDAHDAGGSIKSWAEGIPVIGKITTIVFAAIAAVQSFGLALQRALSLAIERQDLVAQFTAFYGSADKAKKKIEEFDDYADSARFEFKDVATAGRRLDVLTQGAFAGKEALEMIGDAAHGTGANFADLGTNLGLLYAKLSEGDPIAGPLKSLQKLGIIAPDAAAKMREMADAGEPLQAIWSIATQQMERYKGTTAAMKDTFSGSVNAMKESWNDVLLALATPVLDVLSPYIVQSTKAMEEAKGNISPIVESIKGVINVFGGMFLIMKTGFTIVSGVVKATAVTLTNFALMLGALADRDFTRVKDIFKLNQKAMVEIAQESTRQIQADTETWINSVITAQKKIEESRKGVDNGAGVGIDTDDDALIKKEEQLASLRRKNSEKNLTDREKILALEKRIAEVKAEQNHYELISAGATDKNTKKKFKDKAVDASLEVEQLVGAKAELVNKQEDDRLKLVDSISKLKTEIAEAEMTNEEKLTNLISARYDASQRAAFEEGNEALKWREEELVLTKKIADVEKAILAEKKQIQDQEKAIAKAKQAQAESERDRLRSSLGDIAKQTSGSAGYRARKIQKLEEGAKRDQQFSDTATDPEQKRQAEERAKKKLEQADALRGKTAGLKDSDRDPSKAFKAALADAEEKLAKLVEAATKPLTARVNSDGSATVTQG